MEFDVDSGIFIGFLVATIILGLASSRGIRNIKEYAVGNRDFSTATIVATLVATWVSGSFFYNIISEGYSKGLYSMWSDIGDPICLLLIGMIFAVRMGEFLGKLSIAEAMGDLFGQKVRIITAIAGFIGITGKIAIQLKLAGLLFSYVLDISSGYGTIIAAFIITLYSSLGGIKSVTFTDIIQFLTFIVVIPVIAYALLNSIDNTNIIINTLTTHPVFDYKEVFNFSNALSLDKLFVFLYFITPAFNPAIFQRIAMAKDIIQVRKSFVISAVICFLLLLILDWITILTLSINPFLNPDEVVKEIIFSQAYLGLKGMAIIGIMAMIMSTVDSFINSTAVLVVHDFLKPLKIEFNRNELLSARIISIIIGLVSLLLSLRQGNFLTLMIMTSSLYMPIVTVPFIMAIFGFRSSGKSVMLGMAAGISTV
jgi:Na+/proline symporter